MWVSWNTDNLGKFSNNGAREVAFISLDDLDGELSGVGLGVGLRYTILC